MLLDGQAIGSLPAKKVAKTLGLLPQSSIAPDGITVSDLVSRGRYPHQGLLRQWSQEDERIVHESMASTGVAELADRAVDELSGGQRQRVWIAMALAQQTPLLLLDEPTTYLDIQHQLDVLDLCAELHENQGRTLVAVLHDLNHAARYATHLIALRGGEVIAEGPLGRGGHGGTGGEGVRAALPGHRRPRDGDPAGDPGGPAGPGEDLRLRGLRGLRGLSGLRGLRGQSRLLSRSRSRKPASSLTRPEAQALANFSSPATIATRSSPVIASRISALAAGGPGATASTRIRPPSRRPVKVWSRSVMWQLRERSSAAAPRTSPSARARLPESWSSASRHSSIVAIVITTVPQSRVWSRRATG